MCCASTTGYWHPSGIQKRQERGMQVMMSTDERHFRLPAINLRFDCDGHNYRAVSSDPFTNSTLVITSFSSGCTAR